MKKLFYTLGVIGLLTLFGCCETRTVNHQKDLIYGDTRIITDTVWLADNGSHVDIVIFDEGKYVSFGWGSLLFFEEVGTWDDLTFDIAYRALFDDNQPAIRLTYMDNLNPNWIPVGCTFAQYMKLLENLNDSFATNEMGYSLPINRLNKDSGNTLYFQAKGEYRLNYTCNTWANEMFKNSGMYARNWTVFSSGLTSLY